MQATIVFEQNWHAIHQKNDDGTRKYRYIINKGSSRSSKTISLIDCYDLYARSEENKRLTVWRDTKTDCKKTVLNDMLKRLKSTRRYKVKQDFNKTESIFQYTTESTVEIHGTDDEETVHGLTQDAAWFNEPYKISRDTFDQIDQRTSDFIFIDYNPKKGHWIDDLIKDPRTIVIHSTYKDNPFCPTEQRIKIESYQPVSMCALVVEKKLREQEAKDYDYVLNPNNYSQKQIAELVRCRENEAKNTSNLYKWQVYGLGLKGERPNRIFHWTAISPEQYKAISAPIYVGVDWGVVDPWGIVEAKYYDGGLYLRQLNYDSENQVRSKMTAIELQQVQTKGEGEEGIVQFMFNRLGIDKNAEIICDNNRPTKIAILRRMGYSNAKAATKGQGSIEDGIDYLSNINVYYTSDSENLEYEQENYSRKVDRYGIILEEPEDVDNHLIDPTRYIAARLIEKGILKAI